MFIIVSRYTVFQQVAIFKLHKYLSQRNNSVTNGNSGCACNVFESQAESSHRTKTVVKETILFAVK